MSWTDADEASGSDLDHGAKGATSQSTLLLQGYGLSSCPGLCEKVNLTPFFGSAVDALGAEPMYGSPTAQAGQLDVAAFTSSGSQISDLRTINSEEANAPFISDAAVAQGWWPPYADGPSVRTFTAVDDLQFVRIHTDADRPQGFFLVRQDEIAHFGNNAEVLQKYLGLNKTPEFISDVTVPAGTRMQVGIIGPQPNFELSTNSGFQYHILDDIPRSSFHNTRPLQ